MEKLTEEEKEEILQAANNITHAFFWKNTKQGHAYWYKIRNELLELAKEEDKETKCPTCGKEMEE